MTQVLSFAPRPIHDTASHHHMDLDRAVRVGGPPGVFAPRRSPSPGSSSFTRKRAASLTSADATHGLYEQLSINTSGPAMRPETSRDAICLCTPTPKIPRPRNGSFDTCPLSTIPPTNMCYSFHFVSPAPPISSHGG